MNRVGNRTEVRQFLTVAVAGRTRRDTEELSPEERGPSVVG